MQFSFIFSKLLIFGQHFKKYDIMCWLVLVTITNERRLHYERVVAVS